MDPLNELMLTAAGGVVAFAIGWASLRFTKRTGVEIDAKYRDGLHTALMTIARIALAKQLTGAVAIKIMWDYVSTVGAPDAVKHFGLNLEKIETLAESKLEQAKKEAVVIVKDKLTESLQDAIRR